MKTNLVSSRGALAGMATLPLTVASVGAAQASAPMLGAQTPMFSRVKLGEFDVTTLLAGTRTVPEPQNIFGMNVSAEEFAQASAVAKLPTDKAQFFFTPTVVNTGSELILFDTGLSGEGTTAALEAAGYTADQIDIVVITHMHGAQIGGLITENAPTFPNARFFTGTVDLDSCSNTDNDTSKDRMSPVAAKNTLLADNSSVARALRAIARSRDPTLHRHPSVNHPRHTL